MYGIPGLLQVPQACESQLVWLSHVVYVPGALTNREVVDSADAHMETTPACHLRTQIDDLGIWNAIHKYYFFVLRQVQITRSILFGYAYNAH